jgi:hypothetical protein
MIIQHQIKPLLHKRCAEIGVNSNIAQEKKKLAKAMGLSDAWFRRLWSDPYMPISKEYELKAIEYLKIKPQELYVILENKKRKKTKALAEED